MRHAEFICDEIVEWARGYSGPKCHALLCDPPYHLYSRRTAGEKDQSAFPGARSNPSPGGFMGKKWDGGDVAFQPETWAALAEHLHPGAFGMAFASARGWHRLAVAIEEAGLIIHPSIFGWAYGSGFPKASRIDTAIDRAAGVEREVTGKRTDGVGAPGISTKRPTKNEGIWVDEFNVTAPATPLARAWAGHRYGLQALKPSLEPIIVFQKPYEGKPIECITRTGAGALNIDGGRIGTAEEKGWPVSRNYAAGQKQPGGSGKTQSVVPAQSGRWPANFALVHSPECRPVGTERVKGSRIEKPCEYGGDAGMFGHGGARPARGVGGPDGMETVERWACVAGCPVRALDEQAGEKTSGRLGPGHIDNGKVSGTLGAFGGREIVAEFGGDSSPASRFFFRAAWEIENANPVHYCAKASREERDAGLYGEATKQGGMRSETSGQHITRRDGGAPGLVRNNHPCVKPIELCAWLATLLLPPSEYSPRRILVPFAGSGSEVIGALRAGWDEAVAIEREAEYVAIARTRVAADAPMFVEVSDG